MVKKAVPIIVALLVGWFGHAILFPPRVTYTGDKAAEICHQAQRDKWRETAVLEFSGDWPVDSDQTNVPGWIIRGTAFAVGEDGATTYFAYTCTFARRELRMTRFYKIDPPEDRD